MLKYSNEQNMQKRQINFSACQHFEEKVLNPILKSDKYRITNVLVFFQTIRKLLGHHFTWLHNECCVRFSKLKFRPSAGFSAWFRDHTGSGGPGFRTKGATACATFALPLSYLWQELLPFSAQQVPLHCTQITVQGTVGRGSEENIYIFTYVRTCILCIGTLTRILGALQSLHKAGIATFS